MLTNKWQKLIQSLYQKKYRKEHQLFIVEGVKSIIEVMHSSYELESIWTAPAYESLWKEHGASCPVNVISEKQLQKISILKNNQTALALARTKENHSLELIKGEPLIVLDEIRDPGNLGTIIRICDWYGISKMVCAPNTVDLYNPKLIQACMGSFTRVEILYTDLLPYLSTLNRQLYACTMEGESIHQTSLDPEGVYIFGNESKGIREEILQKAMHKISIPRFGQAESLNVAIATAIVCDRIKSL